MRKNKKEMIYKVFYNRPASRKMESKQKNNSKIMKERYQSQRFKQHFFVVKQLVELHGGQIFLESTPGKGTEVIFTIPLTQPQKRQEPEQQPAHNAGTEPVEQ